MYYRAMKYLLYKLQRSAQGDEADGTPQIPGKIAEFSLFSLRWLFPLVRIGGTEYLKAIVMAAWSVFACQSRISEFRVYAFIGCNGNVLHYSVVSPTTIHLPWLSKDEAGSEIGGCLTVPVARGKKIYPYVLRQVSHSTEHSLPIYMIVEDSNAASQAGIKQAGFELVHQVRRKRGLARPPQYEYQPGE